MGEGGSLIRGLHCLGWGYVSSQKGILSAEIIVKQKNVGGFILHSLLADCLFLLNFVGLLARVERIFLGVPCLGEEFRSLRKNSEKPEFNSAYLPLDKLPAQQGKGIVFAATIAGWEMLDFQG